MKFLAIIFLCMCIIFNKVDSCNPYSDEETRIDNSSIIAFVKSAKLINVSKKKYNGNVDSVRYKCATALSLAAIEGRLEIVKLLLDKGADLEAAGYFGKTPLFYAVGAGQKEISELLIQFGANVNAKNHVKNTPLFLAAEKGEVEMVKLLINLGADINYIGWNHRTALNVAADLGNADIARLLIENGVDYRNRDSDGFSAKDRAIENRHFEVVDVIPKISHEACSCYSKLNKMQEVPIVIDERIIDGVLAEFEEFPWMAALAYIDFTTGNITFDCGGTLISDSFILTAAHCVRDNRRPDRVRLGAIDLRDYGSLDLLQIKNITKHPEYSPRYKKNDIALIELLEPVKLSESIKPACLYLDKEDVDRNVDLKVTGWGLNSTDPRLKSDVLLQTKLKTMPISECNVTLLEFSRGKNIPSIQDGISESQYCAYDPEGKKDSCEGDSGGPLQITGNGTDPATIVGVVSFNGAGTCGSKLPSIYTRVASYITWIETIVWPNDNFTPPEVDILDFPPDENEDYFPPTNNSGGRIITIYGEIIVVFTLLHNIYRELLLIRLYPDFVMSSDRIVFEITNK